MGYKFNKFHDDEGVDDDLFSSLSAIPQNSVEVLTGGTEVAGKRYASIANAITYINTQTPALNNLWSICSLNQTNAENFTLPDYVGLHSPKGFQGVVQTIFSGNITIGAYSVVNSVNLTGQITAGSTNSGAPSITYGSYLSGTLVIAAGTYFQPVNTLLQVSSNLELNGQMQVLGGTWISNAINVNAGGVLVGYWDMFGGTVVNNGGTIQVNPYGNFYDNVVSGLTADTVGDAIDEVLGRIPATTDDLAEGSTNLYFNGKTTDDLAEGSTNEYWGGHTTDDLTEGTTNTYSLWEVNAGDEAELKTQKDINIGGDYKLFFN
jgi:hypothetical protein